MSYTAICEDCWQRRMSGYMPYYGFSCDGCPRLSEGMMKMDRCAKWSDCSEYSPRKCHGDYAQGCYQSSKETVIEDG